MSLIKSNKCFLTLGEIMLRLSTPNGLRISQSHNLNMFYGGSEANVAVSLANFGLESSVLTCLPNNLLTDTIIAGLKAKNVKTDNILYGDGRLGLYFVEKGQGYRRSNVIYDRKGSAFAKLEENTIGWDAVFQDKGWFHWSGINPAISPKAAKVTLRAVREASQRGLTISGDLNYRSKLWQGGRDPKKVVPELLEYCDVLFADLHAIEKMLDIKTTFVRLEEQGADLNKYKGVYDKIKFKFPKLSKLFLSFRNNNSAALLYAGTLFSEEGIVQSPIYRINEVADRIGTGDAFVAGGIYALNSYQKLQKIIDFAIASGVIKHAIKGDFNTASKEEVLGIIENNFNISR